MSTTSFGELGLERQPIFMANDHSTRIRPHNHDPIFISSDWGFFADFAQVFHYQQPQPTPKSDFFRDHRGMAAMAGAPGGHFGIQQARHQTRSTGSQAVARHQQGVSQGRQQIPGVPRQQLLEHWKPPNC